MKQIDWLIVLFCIVLVYFYSASDGMSLSEALEMCYINHLDTYSKKSLQWRHLLHWWQSTDSQGWPFQWLVSQGPVQHGCCDPTGHTWPLCTRMEMLQRYRKWLNHQISAHNNYVSERIVLVLESVHCHDEFSSAQTWKIALCSSHLHWPSLPTQVMVNLLLVSTLLVFCSERTLTLFRLWI